MKPVVKKPTPGSRKSQGRVDQAEMGWDKKRKAMKRTVTDKATGAKVYPMKDLNEYSKIENAYTNARIDHKTATQKAKIKNSIKKKK